MMKKDFYPSENEQFERLLHYGIAAVKGKDLQTARRWLEKAAQITPSDARSWLWLSATTSDPGEQRTFLERAVAADPSNAAARRGLVLLSAKLEKERLLAEGQTPERLNATATDVVEANPYQCPNCGGQLKFEPIAEEVQCAYCGHHRQVIKESLVEPAEQPMDFVLPTSRAHRWAEAQQRVACQNCGSLTLLPPGQRSDQCPYCGSNRLIDSAEQAELVPPQAILIMKVNEAKASEQAKKWLGSGLFAPDDLGRATKKLIVRPAYYPFWTFNGTLEIPWRCEVNEGTGKNPNWVFRNGTEFEFFDDVLISGLRSLSDSEVASIAPFPLKQLQAFSPEQLAGWLALDYDLPLSDASLNARQTVIKQVRRDLYHKIEPGREKRNLDNGAGKWSGMTFKNILLPLWVSTYTYQGKVYRVLVNGVTGKAGGSKPRDSFKIALVILLLIAIFALIALVFYWLSTR